MESNIYERKGIKFINNILFFYCIIASGKTV